MLACTIDIAAIDVGTSEFANECSCEHAVPECWCLPLFRPFIDWKDKSGRNHVIGVVMKVSQALKHGAPPNPIPFPPITRVTIL